MIDINSEIEGAYFIIRISGDVDASSSIHLDNAIADAIDKQPKYILIDCSDLNYISSAGLGVFMSYLQEFEAKDIELVVFGLSKKVFNVFEILGLDQLLRITETEGQAKNLNA